MIIFHPNSQQFHLANSQISYLMEIMENGQLSQLYFGKRIKDKESFAYLRERFQRALTPNSHPEAILALQYTRQEYPAYGNGDFRYPAFGLLQQKGSSISNFVYQSHQIFSGKKSINPLPASYAECEDEAESLEINFYDEVTGTTLLLSYTIFSRLPIITRHARFTQIGQEPVILQNAMSLCLDLPDMDWQMFHFSGAWGRERYLKQRPLQMGIQAISSMRGSSSAEHNPSFLLKRPQTTEHQGEAIGFSLVYSGSFLAQAEVSTFEDTRILLGIHPDSLNWKLLPGEVFVTPEAVLAYSDQGLNHLSQSFHQFFWKHLHQSQWKNLPRPILLNNWEATEMNFDEDLILKIAQKAKEAGVELLVLDDGWFGSRNDDTQGLGDWFSNLEKLPQGVEGLSHKIVAMGLQFGLWIEPEMVNKKSRLYQEHPDWLLADPERYASPSRNQFVLDYSRQEVVDGIFEMLDKILANSKISYIKWDMNRYITECYSNTTPADEQGKVWHRYILGVYDLYHRLTNKYPDILFESCSSGGGRFDAGILAFAPQTWTSDNSDAIDRCRIQYGSSYFYPISSMGAHVSVSPNLQTGRRSPLQTRANIAFFGAFGYELDLNLLSDEELFMVKKQIEFYKTKRSLFQYGDFYRLLSPFEGSGDTAFMTVSPDKKSAILAYFQSLILINTKGIRLKLAGLCPDKKYLVRALFGPLHYHREHFGDELLYAGLFIDRNALQSGGDFNSLLFEIEAVDQ